MEEKEGKRGKDELFSGLNRFIGKINELVEDFERESLGKTSFVGGFKSEMEKMQIFIQDQRDEINKETDMLSIRNDQKAVNEKNFGSILNSQRAIKGGQEKMEGKIIGLDGKVENTRNEMMKSLQEIYGIMVKNQNDVMKRLQETRDHLDKNSYEINNAVKSGAQQSKTWVDMAMGNNLAISQKVKEIQQSTKAVVLQNEYRQREINSLRVVVKGIKEIPRKDDLIKEIVDLCGRNFKNVVFKEDDFSAAFRIGPKRRDSPRPVVLCFKDKNMRRIFWAKRFYLGKGEKVFVDADLSLEQRRLIRERVQEIRNFNLSKSQEDKIKYKRVGYSLVVEGRLFSNMEMKLEQFLNSTLK